MKDVEKTIGNLIDKQKIAFIGSVDIEGFPNIKAMLQPGSAKVSGFFILPPIPLLCVPLNT